MCDHSEIYNYQSHTWYQNCYPKLDVRDHSCKSPHTRKIIPYNTERTKTFLFIIKALKDILIYVEIRSILEYKAQFL
jgi:hypothetical protein